jgi:nucleoside-diphosphate-sugar epimerase
VFTPGAHFSCGFFPTLVLITELGERRDLFLAHFRALRCGPEFAFHAATALGTTGRTDRERYTRVNVGGARNLPAACAAEPHERIAVLGGSLEYGRRDSAVAEALAARRAAEAIHVR